MPVWRGILNLVTAGWRVLPTPGLWVAGVLLWFAARAVAGYSAGMVPLTVVVDGVSQNVRTRCATVGEVLSDMGVQFEAWDSLSPQLDAPVERRMAIAVNHARQVTIVADGRTISWYTLNDTASEILAQAGVTLGVGDGLWVNGSASLAEATGLALAAPLADDASGAQVLRASSGLSSRGHRLPSALPISTIEVRRASRIEVQDYGIEQSLYTRSQTVGEALAQAGVVLYLGDRLYPGPATQISPGLRVRIDRGVTVYVDLDGASLRARTRGRMVQDVLAELGVVLSGSDFVEPDRLSPVVEGMRIRVVRVVESLLVEQDEIPFETQWIADPSLELDHRRVDQVGANGITRWRFRVTYHDGQESARVLEERWIAQEPQPRQIAYGTKIVVRTLDTPDGPIEYWRRIRVFLTSYTAATCGKMPGDPLYGITRLGWTMRHGIIAVDPAVIRLRSQLYVPGYGPGVAGDTGGMINGRHIDLGHEEDNFTMYYWWGEVYVRTPVPPSRQINWILPDYPRER